MGDDLKIKMYDNWHKISKRNSVIVVYGSRGSGKSHFICWLLTELDRQKPFDFVWCMTPTQSTQEALQRYVAPSGIHTNLDPECLQNVVDIQKMQPGKHRVCVILDDCAFDRKFSKSNVVSEIAANGRHLNLTLVLSFQYLSMLPPDLRTNTDIAVTFKEVSCRNVDLLYENFFGVLDSVATFKTIMSCICKRFRALIMDNTRDSLALSDCLWMCKAPAEIPRRHVASLQWRMHNHFGFSAKSIQRGQQKVMENRLIEKGILPAPTKKPKKVCKDDNATMVVFE